MRLDLCLSIEDITDDIKVTSGVNACCLIFAAFSN